VAEDTCLRAAAFDHLSRVMEQTSWKCGACSNFLLRSPDNSITDPSGVCKLMDCSAMVFVDDFSKFFNIFCRFAGAWSPEHSSSSTDTQPALKLECHSKTTVWLKECSLNALMKNFSGFGNRLTKLHTKLVADKLLNFAIHRR
jgi:hypothetical protein